MWIRFKPRNQKCKDCGKDYLAKSGVSLYCVVCKKLRKQESKKRFKKTVKGIAARKRWDRSEKGKASYKRYRNTDKYRAYAKNRYKNTPENIKKAHYYVHNTIRDGKLVRLKNCQTCGIKDWGIKRSMIEAHHYKGYDQKFWLAVQWLCTNCHREVVLHE